MSDTNEVLTANFNGSLTGLLLFFLIKLSLIRHVRIHCSGMCSFNLIKGYLKV